MQGSPRRVDFVEGYTVRLRAALNGGDGKLMTLSEGGAYVATPINLLPQAQLSVAIDIPELEQTVEVEAVVAWENRGKPRPSSTQPEGYGIRFIRVPTASADAIRWLLRREAEAQNDPERTRALSPAEVREAIERANRIASSVRQPSSTFEEPEGPPYRLDPSVIEARVPPSVQGVFVLSYDRTLDARIGRADSDLRKSLNEFVDTYAYFHFEVISSSKERFERECELFHRFGGDRGQLDNVDHPLPPAGPQLKCPLCVRSN
jgi:hypothetical protein